MTHILVVAMTLSMTLSAAGIVMTCREQKQGNLVRHERIVQLHDCKINIIYSTADGLRTIRKRWGDACLGMELGRVMNGSWSSWNFFRCLERKGNSRQTVNLVNEFVPQHVIAYDVHGVGVLDWSYPSLNGRGKLHLRLMHLPSHRCWVFLRVNWKGFMPQRLDLYAYPGGANRPRDREHWLGTPMRRVNLDQVSVSMDGKEDCLAFYNKYAQTKAGNFLVYQASAFEKVSVPKAPGQGVSIHMVPAPGVHEAFLALGYFRDEEAEFAVRKFLVEDADSIGEFMKTLDWNPRPSLKQLDLRLTEAKELGIGRELLNSLQKDISTAAANQQNATLAMLLHDLECVIEDAASKALDGYR